MFGLDEILVVWVGYNSLCLDWMKFPVSGLDEILGCVGWRKFSVCGLEEIINVWVV